MVIIFQSLTLFLPFFNVIQWNYVQNMFLKNTSSHSWILFTDANTPAQKEFCSCTSESKVTKMKEIFIRWIKNMAHMAQTSCWHTGRQFSTPEMSSVFMWQKLWKVSHWLPHFRKWENQKSKQWEQCRREF